MKSEKAKKHGTAKREGLAPEKLKLLVTVVNLKKADFYLDFLQSFDVNMQCSFRAEGTASSETLRRLSLIDAEKGVIFSVIREDREREILEALGEKFRTVRGGKGIAFTSPLSSTVGVAIYQFLGNIRKEGQGQ